MQTHNEKWLDKRSIRIAYRKLENELDAYSSKWKKFRNNKNNKIQKKRFDLLHK